ERGGHRQLCESEWRCEECRPRRKVATGCCEWTRKREVRARSCRPLPPKMTRAECPRCGCVYGAASMGGGEGNSDGRNEEEKNKMEASERWEETMKTTTLTLNAGRDERMTNEIE